MQRFQSENLEVLSRYCYNFERLPCTPVCVSKDARELKGGQWSGERLAPNRVPDDLTEKIWENLRLFYRDKNMHICWRLVGTMMKTLKTINCGWFSSIFHKSWTYPLSWFPFISICSTLRQLGTSVLATLVAGASLFAVIQPNLLQILRLLSRQNYKSLFLFIHKYLESHQISLQRVEDVELQRPAEQVGLQASLKPR